MPAIHGSRLDQVKFALSALNRSAKEGLVTADVSGKANLSALIDGIKARRQNVLVKQEGKMAMRALEGQLWGLKDLFPDATVAAITTLRGTDADTDLRHLLWKLLPSTFSKEYNDIIVEHSAR
jgi:hypothetical protein